MFAVQRIIRWVAGAGLSVILCVIPAACSPGKLIPQGPVVDAYDLGRYAVKPIEKRFPSGDGSTLYAWWLTQPDASLVPTVIYFYGLTYTLGDAYSLLEFLYKSLHVNVFAVDYPGTGCSRGDWSLGAALVMAESTIDYVRRLESVRADGIVIYGTSIGTLFALHAAEGDARIPVILESPVTNANDYIRSHWFRPGLPKRVIDLIAENFDNYAAVSRLPNPKLFLYGLNDQVVGCRNIEKLIAAAREPKRHLALDAGHGCLKDQGKGAEVKQAILEFLRSGQTTSARLPPPRDGK